jgi:hypothetical protein
MQALVLQAMRGQAGRFAHRAEEAGAATLDREIAHTGLKLVALVPHPQFPFIKAFGRRPGASSELLDGADVEIDGIADRLRNEAVAQHACLMRPPQACA